MKRIVLALVLSGCATAVRDDVEEPDAGNPFIQKDAGPKDTGTAQDTWQPQDTGVTFDTGVIVDSGSCTSCDLADEKACNGTQCGWDSMQSTSKCGYQLGTGGQGTPCSQQMPSCAAGHVCITPQNKCVHWCKKPNGACPASTACTGTLQSPPLVCGVTYGFCQ